MAVPKSQEVMEFGIVWPVMFSFFFSVAFSPDCRWCGAIRRCSWKGLDGHRDEWEASGCNGGNDMEANTTCPTEETQPVDFKEDQVSEDHRLADQHFKL